MNKKASLSLSINAIVVLILAIAMLGLALGFIKTMFGKVSGQVEELIATEVEPQPATESQPISLSKGVAILKTGESGAVKMSVYNAGATAFALANVIEDTVGCFDTSGGVTPINKLTLNGQSKQSIPSRTSRTVAVGFKPRETKPDDFVCGICTVAGLGPVCADLRVVVKS